MCYKVCDMDSNITWPYQMEITTVGPHGCIIKTNTVPINVGHAYDIILFYSETIKDRSSACS